MAEAVPVSPVRVRPHGLKLWWQAIRPRTLTIAVSPVLAGAALAYADQGGIDPLLAAAALLGALSIQAGTNLYNDAGDYLKGGDQPLRQGPARVTAMGWASPSQVKRAAFLCFLLAALTGLFLILAGGWPILALGLASLLAGWAYSSGPRPIAYTPLGELFVIGFFGLGAAGGSYYLLAQSLTRPVLMAGLALGFIAAGVLMANNYRDLEPDRLAGRRTLAILAGPELSKVLYALFIVLPFVLVMPPLGPSGGWLVLLLAPLAYKLLRDFLMLPRGPAFNSILAATAAYQMAFACLLALGALL
ncbi:MAG: 1,4-dihydroxy-2-naphthoate octaprenyltransferase [Alphaproteobacteria bacterium]|nr:1,4-dihydroxy-2-naphthoate octaprenyltransferase [Alphaproteobacteria bacterium]